MTKHKQVLWKAFVDKAENALLFDSNGLLTGCSRRTLGLLFDKVAKVAAAAAKSEAESIAERRNGVAQSDPDFKRREGESDRAEDSPRSGGR